MSKAVVYDIDGVVSTGDGPLHSRKPNKKVLRRIHSQSKDGKKVFYNTNRPIRFKQLTEKWLESHGAPNDGVCMPSGKGHVGNKQHNLDRLARKHKIEEVWENDDRIIRGVKGHPMRNVKEIDKSWKNITESNKDARNGRRSKRYGETALGLGSAVAGYGIKNAGFRNEYVKGERAGFLASPRGIEHGLNLPKKSGPFKTITNNGTKLVGVKSGKRYIAGTPKKMAPIAAGAALIAAGAGATGYGMAKERIAENRIKRLRKQRAVSKRISPFGVEI